MMKNDSLWRPFPVGIYLVIVSNKNSRTMCEICPKLTIKTPERHQWHGLGVFIFNFEYISHLVLVFLLLTLNTQLPVGLSCFHCKVFCEDIVRCSEKKFSLLLFPLKIYHGSMVMDFFNNLMSMNMFIVL